MTTSIQHLTGTMVSAEVSFREGGIDRIRRDPKYGYQLIHFDLNQLRQPSVVQAIYQVPQTGIDLASVFSTLTRKQQQAAAGEVARLVPAFADVDVVPSAQGPGTITMRFNDRWNPRVWYSPSEVSDGTMLVTAFVLLQFQQTPVTLIAIEEPERGVHPYLLGDLVAFWRKMTQGQIGGRPVQIVLATHSAELLEYVEPDEVRFLSRDSKTGEARVQEAPTNDEHWRDAYATYQESLGGMWLSGGLGGVPGR